MYQGSFAPLVAAVRDRLPELRHLIQVDDGSGEPLLPGAIDYEAWVSAASDVMPDLPYTPDDVYLLYTGGTTGMPKGVLWRHEDVFFNGLGGHVPGFPRLETDEQLRPTSAWASAAGRSSASPSCTAPASGAFNAFHRGGAIVLPEETRNLDADAVWHAVERHRSTPSW